MNSRTADDVVQKTHNWSDRKRLFTDARSGSLYWLLRRRGGSSHSRAIEGYGVWLLAHPLAPPGRRALVVDSRLPGQRGSGTSGLGFANSCTSCRSKLAQCRSNDKETRIWILLIDFIFNPVPSLGTNIRLIEPFDCDIRLADRLGQILPLLAGQVRNGFVEIPLEFIQDHS